MHIDRLRLRNFRNYREEEFRFSPLTNLIYGDNAQGKTNILEAVYLFAQGRSHRTRTDKEMVRFGEDFAELSLDFADSEREYSARFTITKVGRKSVTINHVHIGKLSKLMNFLNVVMFSPEDLRLVKGSPAGRRRFADSSLSQLYPSYLSALSDYGKALAQKGSLLKALRAKGARDDPTLEIWNEQLARHGARISRERARFTELIHASASRIQNEISGETLDIEYVPSVKVADMTEESFLEYLRARERREIEAGAALYGVQRDDLLIRVDGRDAKLFASQGQQRTAALAMKIAQSEYIKDVKGEYPVLLLDDIMSELDVNRRRYLSEKIRDKQVLITSTDTDISAGEGDTRLFRICGGKVVG